MYGKYDDNKIYLNHYKMIKRMNQGKIESDSCINKLSVDSTIYNRINIQ